MHAGTLARNDHAGPHIPPFFLAWTVPGFVRLELDDSARQPLSDSDVTWPSPRTALAESMRSPGSCKLASRFRCPIFTQSPGKISLCAKADGFRAVVMKL
ncbi:hypothetical protein OpiT1DRAFT_00058 [Opitutaceae bacterium TAV1]|nr:hypothetical protein OPIT5_27460 [Opitutaceae bacterium TAV5]EIQ01488.1 hypothetical protein OpiT1DRAFT_00058 [Opitutaceae bacterium TAV1]